MKAPLVWAAGAFVLAVAGAATFWWLASPRVPTTAEVSSAGDGAILYYQDPSGAAEFSATPKKDSQGRDFVAVRASGTAAVKSETASSQRQILYYRNPMGLADTSPEPKKDSMGMDYIPVYADEVDQKGTVKISLDKVQRLGVRTAKAMRQVLNETVMLSGTVTADERRQSVVALKFNANIVKLHVAATGERVRVGQPLFDVHSPFLLQQETTLAIAFKAQAASQELGGVYARANARSAATARERLALYEVPEQEIQRLIRTGEPSGHVTWRATQAGTVMTKFSVWAMYSVGLIVLSGVVIAFVQVESPSKLLGNDYGTGLIRKLVLVAIILGLAAYNKFVLTPALEKGDATASHRIRRTIRIEIGIYVLILGAAMSLTLTTPPRAILAQGAGGMAMMNEGYKATAQANGYTVELDITPAKAGENMIMATVKDKDGQVITTLADFEITGNLPAAGISDVLVKGQNTGNGMWHFMFQEMIIPGDWTLKVDAFVNDFDKVTFETTVPIK